MHVLLQMLVRENGRSPCVREELVKAMAAVCISFLRPLSASAASDRSVLEHCIWSHGVRMTAGAAGVS